ncbi:MAG: hypothetical protein ACE5LU_23945, partial [Anaerolineae bacterium]
KVQYAWQRSTAWVLMIIAIVFWLWFGIGSAYVERAGPLNWLMHILMPAGIFILSIPSTSSGRRLGQRDLH